MGKKLSPQTVENVWIIFLNIKLWPIWLSPKESNSKWARISKQFKDFLCFLWYIVNKMWFYEWFINHVILVLFTVYTASHFLEVGLYIITEEEKHTIKIAKNVKCEHWHVMPCLVIFVTQPSLVQFGWLPKRNKTRNTMTA